MKSSQQSIARLSGLALGGSGILSGLCSVLILLASPAVKAQLATPETIDSKQKSKLPPVPLPKCLKWTEQVVPFNLTLPPTFANGCGYYIALGGNNEATIAYVFKNGVNPNLPAQLGELTPKFERQLDNLGDASQALKIGQYSLNTVGSQRLTNISPEVVFVDEGGGLCKRFDRRVVCLETRALTNRQLVQMFQLRPEKRPEKLPARSTLKSR